MSRVFSTLSRSERLAFWQEMEGKLREALQYCEHQLPAGLVAEIGEYLDHNELGLAWEALGEALIEFDVLPPEPARQLLLETGNRMGFDPAESRNNV